MPMSLGPVRVKFVYFETPRELFYTLRGLELELDADPLARENIVFLAVPDKLRRFMDWPEKATPKPEVHGDALVFRKG
jgi:hypothetical protein